LFRRSVAGGGVARGGEGRRSTYLSYGVLARAVDDVVLGSLASNVVDAHELEQRRVDEAHADAVPDVHRRQIGDDRQRRAEAVGRGEKVEHGGDADHDARRHRVPLQPERNERARDQNDARNEHRREVEGAVAREDQLHSQAAVVACANFQQNRVRFVRGHVFWIN